ncbi:unnamed protein product [Didymodactylos carnosus]|uniref:RRM domain-containing protein n=1 Tax=Didymodactylos carnosus TaxID=1234261 RepID=A0A815FHV1_9BILA|nr:unnamed protein product [Didymodactylos carnosus]CAF1328902.1 unnamed protein product [Didymodactylos carnosus]CAF3988807.1 unnamed protein product [Didymodactylos carnosus]CAF4180900.1 unnamed protein product [Didymodactylos carnosus]
MAQKNSIFKTYHSYNYRYHHPTHRRPSVTSLSPSSCHSKSSHYLPHHLSARSSHRSRHSSHLHSPQKPFRPPPNVSSLENQPYYHVIDKYSDKDLGLEYLWDKTVFVSNIPADVGYTIIRRLFAEKVGRVISMEIYRKNGRSLHCGTVELRSVEYAKEAVRRLDEYEYHGKKLSVKMDTDGFRTRRVKYYCVKDSLRLQSEYKREHATTASTSTCPVSFGSSSITSIPTAHELKGVIVALSTDDNGNQKRIVHEKKYRTEKDDKQQQQQQLQHKTSTDTSPASLIHQHVHKNGRPVSDRSDNRHQHRYSHSIDVSEHHYRQQSPEECNRKIFIKNLPCHCSEKKLYDIYSMAGRIHRIKMFKERNGEFRGRATVLFDKHHQAQKAIRMFNGQMLYGRVMNVCFDWDILQEHYKAQKEKKIFLEHQQQNYVEQSIHYEQQHQHIQEKYLSYDLMYDTHPSSSVYHHDTAQPTVTSQYQHHYSSTLSNDHSSLRSIVQNYFHNDKSDNTQGSIKQDNQNETNREILSPLLNSEQYDDLLVLLALSQLPSDILTDLVEKLLRHIEEKDKSVEEEINVKSSTPNQPNQQSINSKQLSSPPLQENGIRCEETIFVQTSSPVAVENTAK